MATLHPETVAIYARFTPAYSRARRELVAREWFDAGGWAFHSVIFADGIGLQMYKLHWYNHLGQGLHLESWISREQLAKKRVALVLHAEPDVPDRALFRERFWPLAREIVDGWEGYAAHPNNRMQLVSGYLPLVRSRLATQLTEEYERLRALGPAIDRALGFTG